MIERYTRPAMGGIWTEENKYDAGSRSSRPQAPCWLRMASFPSTRPEAIANKASFSVARIQEIESEVKHDVIAFTTAVAEIAKK